METLFHPFKINDIIYNNTIDNFKKEFDIEYENIDINTKKNLLDCKLYYLNNGLLNYDNISNNSNLENETYSLIINNKTLFSCTIDFQKKKNKNNKVTNIQIKINTINKINNFNLIKNILN